MPAMSISSLSRARPLQGVVFVAVAAALWGTTGTAQARRMLRSTAPRRACERIDEIAVRQIVARLVATAICMASPASTPWAWNR